MPLRRIYLDHAASTPLDPVAREAMREADERLGSPSGPHAEGRAARDLLETARGRAAEALGCRPRELLFTASGTLACQIALLGVARARAALSRRLVLSAVEHPAIGDAADLLAAEGFEVVRVPPEPDGTVDAGRFLAAAEPGAAAAALLVAHHETGAILPVAEVATALRARSIPLVADACLAPGRLATRVGDLGADLVAWSAHKCGGPRGIGLLYVRRRTRVLPLWRGGLQEERLHPGTEPVAGALGAAIALERAVAATAERSARYAALAARFLERLGPLDGWRLVGPERPRLPGAVTLEIPGVEGEAATINLDLEGVAVSTGSTCALGGSEPSPSLRALGYTPQRAATTLRFTFGEANEGRDADDAAERTAAVVRRLRALARGDHGRPDTPVPRGGR
jgi:cysteine desulfurase